MTFAQLVRTWAPLEVVLADDRVFGDWTKAEVARERARGADRATAVRLEPTVGHVSTAS